MAETFSGRRLSGQYWPVGVREETGLRNDAHRYQETTLRNSGEAHGSPGAACKGRHPPRLLPPARDPTPATHPGASLLTQSSSPRPATLAPPSVPHPAQKPLWSNLLQMSLCPVPSRPRGGDA